MDEDESESAPVEETVVIDAFHRHEVVTTSNLIANLFESEIVEQAWVKSNPELLKIAEDISAKLWDFYQLSAQKSFEEKTQ